MKKIFLAALLCGVLATSCKEDEKTFCYECVTSMTSNDGTGEEAMPDMTATQEHCGITEDQAKAASTTVTTTSGNLIMKTTTACTKK
jgi:hypothetical protein